MITTSDDTCLDCKTLGIVPNYNIRSVRVSTDKNVRSGEGYTPLYAKGQVANPKYKASDAQTARYNTRFEKKDMHEDVFLKLLTDFDLVPAVIKYALHILCMHTLVLCINSYVWTLTLLTFPALHCIELHCIALHCFRTCSKVRFEKFMTAISEKRKYYTVRVKTTLAFKDFKKVCFVFCVGRGRWAVRGCV